MASQDWGQVFWFWALCPSQKFTNPRPVAPGREGNWLLLVLPSVTLGTRDLTNQVRSSWGPVPCNSSTAWPEKLRDLGLLSQMDRELWHWQRLRDTQVDDESFTRQGPHHPRTERPRAISASKVPLRYKTAKTQKQTYPSLGWKVGQGFPICCFPFPLTP